MFEIKKKRNIHRWITDWKFLTEKSTCTETESLNQLARGNVIRKIAHTIASDGSVVYNKAKEADSNTLDLGA